MARIIDAAGSDGLLTDGDWILSENMDSKGSIGVIQLKHVGDGKFLNKEFNFITQDTFDALKCTEVHPGDVLISRMSEPIARACIVPRLPFKCVTAVDVAILRVDETTADNHYIQYACNSGIVRDQAEKLGRGTTRLRITRKALEQITIPLPPLPEQKRIAAILTKADRLRRLRRYALELSDTFLQSVFLQMFGDVVKYVRANELATGWRLAKVDDIKADVRYACIGGPFGSKLTNADYVEQPGVPVIRGANLSTPGLEILESGYVYVSEAKAATLASNTAYAGDIIFTQRGTLGQVARIPEKSRHAKYIISQSQMKLTVDESKVDPVYLIHYFRSPRALQQLKDRTLITGVPHINLGILRDFPVVLPPLVTQKEFAGVVMSMEKFSQMQLEAIRQADHLFFTLLHRAFRGEL